MTTDFFGQKGMVWWKGVVEDRKDPLKLNRLRVRIFGWHTKDKTQMPTEELPWALSSQPLDAGNNIVGVKEGDWVWGFFMDDTNAQHPVVVGYFSGIPETQGEPSVGFNDPTPDEQLKPELQPRPPFQSPLVEDIETQLESKKSEEEQEDTDTRTGRFGNPERLPGDNLAFGVLVSEIEGDPSSPQNFKFDVNQDGVYDDIDAELLAWDVDRDGELNAAEKRARDSGNYNRFVGYFDYSNTSSNITRYPLFTNESTVSRLARNESIEETIVALKRGAKTTGSSASFAGGNFGTLETQVGTPFEEPETPYAAIYPYNHVYESESGHIIEVDDTPKAERLHRYHRSGTFEEIHPSGIRVDKTVDDQYNITEKNYYHHSEESTTLNAATEFRARAGSIMVIESGASMSLEAGGTHNTIVGEDKNVVIKGDHWYFNAGEATLYIEQAVKVFVKDKMSLRVEDDLVIDVAGDAAIRSEGDFQIHSGGNMSITADGTLGVESAGTEVRGPAYGSEMGVAVAAEAGVASPGTGAVPVPLIAVPPEEPENDAEEFQIADAVTTQILPGFILDAPKSGDLYKPISEGGNQTLVCLTPMPGPIKLYHAIPTGELETVDIQYLHEDLSITTWKVVRPKFTYEESGLIEVGVTTGIFEDGRSIWRFSKRGKDYPKQMIMVGGTQDWLIMDSAVRHD